MFSNSSRYMQTLIVLPSPINCIQGAAVLDISLAKGRCCCFDHEMSRAAAAVVVLARTVRPSYDQKKAGVLLAVDHKAPFVDPLADMYCIQFPHASRRCALLFLLPTAPE